MRRLLPLLLLPLAVALHAQPLAEVPPPPAMSEDAVNEGVVDEFEPEVRIIRRGDDTIEEYRVNGQLYMVRITPAKGRPYYLIDSDGSGILDTRREALDNPDIVKWRIFSW
jgi:hypothetical protein